MVAAELECKFRGRFRGGETTKQIDEKDVGSMYFCSCKYRDHDVTDRSMLKRDIQHAVPSSMSRCTGSTNDITSTRDGGALSRVLIYLDLYRTIKDLYHLRTRPGHRACN